MTNLLDHVEQSIRARNLLPQRQRILVAVSGGLDSVVLLHLLHSLAVKYKWKLTVAHFNHQLRGRDSDDDERFVRALSSRLNLSCASGRADVRAHAKTQGLSIEMAARKLRHQFLVRTGKRRRLTPIALAHHADDQVELFFIRLLRGTGSDGLAGMSWHSPSPADSSVAIVRPLLDVSRRDLEHYARENRIRFREDASNASRDILRNRVRHELLPALRRRFLSGVNKTVLRLMEIVRAESEVLTQVTQTYLKAKPPPAFGSLPIAIQRRVLQYQLRQQGVAPDFELIELLRTAPDQAVSVGPVTSVVRGQSGKVKLLVHKPAMFKEGQMTVMLKGRAGEVTFDKVRVAWCLETVKRGLRPKRQPLYECFDADEVGSQVLLRHWRAGDRFHPIGMRSSVKLQDWFTNQKVPHVRRRELIVATTGTGEIFWVEGQRIGERFKLKERTNRGLVWRWKCV